ncbi:YihY/virulence factor BrkB family protein [Mycobacterium cookii]|uniref:YihY/virulence factor BrkB family protein n=1 Tax=Nocardioides furvisabuli TaxID=375542 RepID=A0ABP5ICN9_9ACTN|nr:YihY/virulence factor BrkB family protein [Nocardioides furvisabuli]
MPESTRPDKGGEHRRRTGPRYPTGIPREGWTQVARRVWQEAGADQVPLMAAGVAFWAFISLFPAMVAAVSVYGLLADASTVTRQAEAVAAALPQDAAALVVSQMEAISAESRDALSLSLALSVLLSLWSSSAAVSNLMTAVNAAYDEEETRSYVRRKGLALLLSLGAIVFVLVAIGLIAVAPVLLDTFASPGTTRTMLDVGRWVGLVLAVLTGTAVVYTVAPDRDAPRLAWVSVGSVVATATWMLASLGFSLYVDNLGRYSSTYGSLAGVAVLMLWFWITALVVLVGAEVNAEAEKETDRDTTW